MKDYQVSLEKLRGEAAEKTYRHVGREIGNEVRSWGAVHLTTASEK